MLAQPASSSFQNKPKALPNQPPSNPKSKVTPLKFKLPPKGAPGKQADAGSRSGCPVLNKRLVTLVPATNIGLTIIPHPTFWFNIPYQSNSNSLINFELLNEEETIVYEKTFLAVEALGIININLSNSLPALQIGKNYQWVLSFICNHAYLLFSSINITPFLISLVLISFTSQSVCYRLLGTPKNFEIFSRHKNFSYLYKLS